jgi:hypothetical protein
MLTPFMRSFQENGLCTARNVITTTLDRQREDEMAHTSGPWKSTFTVKGERGVRAASGYICFLPKPFHYSGQDERYENELKECEANALLISAAPDLLQELETTVIKIANLAKMVDEPLVNQYMETVYDATRKARGG